MADDAEKRAAAEAQAAADKAASDETAKADAEKLAAEQAAKAAAKPAAKAKGKAKASDDADEVTVTVIDSLKHDGEPYGDGDEITVSRETAKALQRAGVVALDDA